MSHVPYISIGLFLSLLGFASHVSTMFSLLALFGEARGSVSHASLDQKVDVSSHKYYL